MITCRTILLYSVLFSICTLVMPWLSMAAPGPDTRSILVWGEKDSLGKYNIHLSRHRDGQWSRPEVLFAGSGQNILPAVGSDDQGNLWVAWTELQGVHGTIRYRVSVNGEWSRPAALDTSTISDMAPSLAVAGDGTPWLVYSGSDGIQDDVYSVHWTEEEWSEPVKINRGDDRPDILPHISIDTSGRPVASWQGYNGEQYVTYFSQWNGHNWSPEQEVPRNRMFSGESKLAFLPDERQELPVQNLPNFLKDTSQAVLHYYSSGKGKTIKLNKQK